MADADNKSAADPPEADDREPYGGERLATARREKGIPIAEIAKELHLDEQKVRALERNDFAMLGAPVFAKGHLRKYALLVDVDDDDVFADYYAMTRSEAMPPIVAGRAKIREQVSVMPLLFVLGAIILAGVIYWWFGLQNPELPAVQAPADPVQEVLLEPTELQPEIVREEPVQADTSPPVAADTIDMPSDTVEVVTASVASALPAPAAQNTPAPATEQLSLSLSFSGECWTEISDADGRRLYSRMGRDGQTVELSGKPPLEALFGNAGNVAVQVNNRPYSLPAPARGSRVVRVSILSQ